MTISDLDKRLKSEEINGIYLFYGENTFLLDSYVKKIKKMFGEMIQGINYITISENNIENLIQEMQTPAFGYNKKLIIVKNSNLFKKEAKTKQNKDNGLKDKIKEYIEKNIEEINNNLIVVFCEEKIEKNSLYEIIEKLGKVCAFENLKPVELQKKLKSICNAYGVNAPDSTLKNFIELVGIDMQENINEIRKLIEYAGKGGTITDEAVRLLTIKKIDAVIFDLTDSLGNKNIENAMQVLNDLIYNKEPIQRILITLYNHFKKLYIVKLAEKYNEDIARKFKFKAKSSLGNWKV